MGYMLDTNLFNHLVQGDVLIGSLPEGGQFFVTHHQLDEILEWEPTDLAAKKKRLDLISIVTQVSPDRVPTESFVLGYSRLGEGRLSDGGIYQKIVDKLNEWAPKRSEANTRDALIAETAIKLGHVLITNDTYLKRAVFELGGAVLDLRVQSNFLETK